MIFIKILFVVMAIFAIICAGYVILDLARNKDYDFIGAYSAIAMAFFLLAAAIVIVYYAFWRI